MEYIIFLSLDLGKVLQAAGIVSKGVKDKHIRKGFNKVCRALGDVLVWSKYIRIKGRKGNIAFVRLKACVSYTGYSWLRKDMEVAVAAAAIGERTGEKFFADVFDAMCANILESVTSPEFDACAI